MFFDIMYEPLAGATLTNILRMLVYAKFHISFRYIPRFIYALAISTSTLPLRMMEHIKYDKKILPTEIKEQPIFILGHWRSGTTYLHNVLSLDKNHGYCSTHHSVIPDAFISDEKLLKALVSTSIPETGPMDDVPMSPDLSQEEEYALRAPTPYAYYNGWIFPRNMEFYNKFVCMEGVPEKVIEGWKSIYIYLLKKLTMVNDGKRLVLKNPSNTARIRLLLEMFPDAKFIHIYRNPYHVYFSMMKFMTIVLPRYCVQRPLKVEEMEKLMMELYAKMYKKYIKERNMIPEGNLVEVRYENFAPSPVKELRRIYDTLSLPNFKDSEEIFKKFIKAQSKIRTGKYEVTDEIVNKVYPKWKFVFDEFGYEK